jgi:aminoglycoside 3-N-acetyltransferase
MGFSWAMGFLSVTKSKILEKLNEVGVQKGDAIYVASFVSILGNGSNLLGDATEALLEAVGENGTVVMPVFNWDYCSGAVFDPLKTPSQTGVLTEHFRKHPGVLRSYTPPWCTFAVAGNKANEITAVKGTSSFGPDGILQYLYDLNAKYVLIGCSYNEGAVHVHWLEERYGVPYRYWKRFVGSVRLNGEIQSNVSYMYARQLDVNTDIDSHPLTDIFDKTEKVKIEPLGIGQIRCFRVQDYVQFMEPYFEKDKLAVLSPEAKAYFSKH